VWCCFGDFDSSRRYRKFSVVVHLTMFSLPALVKYLTTLDPYVLFTSFFVLWLLAHYAGLKLFEIGLGAAVNSHKYRNYVSRIYSMPPHRISNLRRLMRSFIFCLYSCSTGFYLLFNYYHVYPDNLLFAWSDNHYVCFMGACAHWAFSLLEDYWSGEATHAFIKNLEAKGASIYQRDLIRHHLVTMFAYIWCMNTHYLSALCVFGLCFELPVFFITYRELIFGYDDVFECLQSHTFQHFKVLWGFIYATWHATRTVFCLHWPWALIFWRKYVSTLPYWSWYVFHFLGKPFCQAIYIDPSLIMSLWYMNLVLTSHLWSISQLCDNNVATLIFIIVGRHLV
jgi:hypothetical protein